MLATQIKNLPFDKLFELKETLIEAGIAFEAGGNPKEVFRRAKHRHIGLMRRIYERLETADSQSMSAMSEAMVELL